MNEEEEQLYIYYIKGVPTYYAYGEPWVAQALFMGDIRYKTAAEAKAAWEKMKNERVHEN